MQGLCGPFVTLHNRSAELLCEAHLCPMPLPPASNIGHFPFCCSFLFSLMILGFSSNSKTSSQSLLISVVSPAVWESGPLYQIHQWLLHGQVQLCFCLPLSGFTGVGLFSSGVVISCPEHNTPWLWLSSIHGLFLHEMFLTTGSSSLDAISKAPVCTQVLFSFMSSQLLSFLSVWMPPSGVFPLLSGLSPLFITWMPRNADLPCPEFFNSPRGCFSSLPVLFRGTWALPVARAKRIGVKKKYSCFHVTLHLFKHPALRSLRYGYRLWPFSFFFT